MSYPGTCPVFFRRSHGLTLIEMITTVAVIAITTSLALPSFARFIDSNQQTTAINQFATSLAQARFRAVSHLQQVILCPSNNQTDCTGGYEWHHGYISFVDSDRDRQRDSNEALIAVVQAYPADISIKTSTGRRKILFRSSGSSAGSNATIKVCSKHNDIAAKALILSNSGRARLSKKAANGGPINCDLA